MRLFTKKKPYIMYFNLKKLFLAKNKLFSSY